MVNCEMTQCIYLSNIDVSYEWRDCVFLLKCFTRKLLRLAHRFILVWSLCRVKCENKVYIGTNDAKSTSCSTAGKKCVASGTTRQTSLSVDGSNHNKAFRRQPTVFISGYCVVIQATQRTTHFFVFFPAGKLNISFAGIYISNCRGNCAIKCFSRKRG